MGSVNLLFGTSLLIMSVIITKSFLYFKYEYPIVKEQRDQLHTELLEAEEAGFDLKN